MDDDALTETLCELLAAADVGAYRPAGPAYTDAEVGIFYEQVGDRPDRAVGVTVYDATDEAGPEPGNAQRFAQVWIRGARGDKRSANQIAGAVFTALHGLTRTSGLLHAERVSRAHLGADGNGRQQRSENFLIILDNQE